MEQSEHGSGCLIHIENSELNDSYFSQLSKHRSGT